MVHHDEAGAVSNEACFLPPPASLLFAVFADGQTGRLLFALCCAASDILALFVVTPWVDWLSAGEYVLVLIVHQVGVAATWQNYSVYTCKNILKTGANNLLVHISFKVDQSHL